MPRRTKTKPATVRMPLEGERFGPCFGARLELVSFEIGTCPEHAPATGDELRADIIVGVDPINGVVSTSAIRYVSAFIRSADRT